LGHPANRLEVPEGWRAEADATGLGSTVADEVDAQLAARRLRPHVHLALRQAVTFRPQLEVVDERFHAVPDLRARRRHVLAVLRGIGPARQLVDRRLDDAHRLAHLLDADLVVVVYVAVLPGGQVELKVVVAGVRHRLADVLVDAGAAQHRPGERPLNGLLRRHDGDALRAL